MTEFSTGSRETENGNRGTFAQLRSTIAGLVAVVMAGAIIIAALNVANPVPALAKNSSEQGEITATERLENAAIVSAAWLGSETSVRNSSYILHIPYGTLTTEDPELYVGTTVIVTAGREGQRRVTRTLETDADGRERIIAITNELINEPVTEVIAVGTLVRDKTQSYGEYINPSDAAISSYFGPRSVVGGSSNHKGVDFAGKKGDAVYAADGGVVIRADSEMRGFGNLVQIEHDNGDITYYAHNSKLLVAEGERVSRGQIIAEMGMTGTATGVHCHFELHIDGQAVNPLPYLPVQ